ncbi:MAG: TIGR01777 family oxidoreductase [Acidobacteria bacterium]|nr:TIGR01777 family oxidoreductase [Acidobacteriota bacterium]
MKLLVTGATGLIGRAICQRLASEGHQIVVLSRRPESARFLSEGRVFGWNPEHGPPSAEVWDGVEAVIHLAGESVAASRWTDEQKRRIRDSRVRGTRHLVDGLIDLADRPKVMVSASAVGFYGDRGDEQIDERSANGEGFLCEVSEQWEREALRAREFGLRVSLVRTGVVLSPNGGALEKMLLPFKLGIGGRLGSGRQWFPWIHIDDIVGIFRHALLTPELSGPINGVAPGIVNNKEFTEVLANVLNRPVFFPVPELALKILMGEMAEVVLSSQRVVPRVALESGYEFTYQMLRPALKDLLGH